MVRGTSRALDAQGKTSLETYAARPRARVGRLAVCCCRAAGRVVSAVTRAPVRYLRIILISGTEYRTSTVSRGRDGVASVFMGGSVEVNQLPVYLCSNTFRSAG